MTDPALPSQEEPVDEGDTSAALRGVARVLDATKTPLHIVVLLILAVFASLARILPGITDEQRSFLLLLFGALLVSAAIFPFVQLLHQPQAVKPVPIPTPIPAPVPAPAEPVPLPPVKEPEERERRGVLLDVFFERNDATPTMKEELDRAETLVFLGVSHRHLESYLYHALNQAVIHGRNLPWKQIEVLFASDDIGECWEPREFGLNILTSIRELATTLSSRPYSSVIPDLDRVEFFQVEPPIMYGGSLLRFTGDEEFSVVYLSFHTPLPNADTKTSYTIRVLPSEVGAKPLYRQHVNSYEHLKTTARKLYSYKSRCIWDASANEWDAFEHRHSVYERVMSELVSFAQFNDSQHVLDLGAGTGRATRVLATAVPAGHLVLLDHSPQMVRKARQNLGAFPWVDCVVGDARKPLFGRYREWPFDRIIVHFSFQHIISERFTIADFARLWKQHLATGGEMVIAVHNSVLSDPEYSLEPWNDPLRKELVLAARELNLTGFLRHGTQRKFSINEIRRGFEGVGYTTSAIAVKEFDRSMADRLALWSVPAVLDSFVDVSRVANRNELLRLVQERVKEIPTPKTTTAFLRFSNPDSSFLLNGKRSWIGHSLSAGTGTR